MPSHASALRDLLSSETAQGLFFGSCIYVYGIHCVSLGFAQQRKSHHEKDCNLMIGSLWCPEAGVFPAQKQVYGTVMTDE